MSAAPQSEALLDWLGSRRAVAVFGASSPQPDEPLYASARLAGARLAAAGVVVLSGGYGGVMEAASRGAREAGGVAIGVTTPIFARTPNPWLDREWSAADLWERTRSLVDAASGFLVLAGSAGTLAEAAFLWALRRAGQLGARPVVLAGEPWPDVLPVLRRTALVEPDALIATEILADVEYGVDRLVALLGPPPGAR